MAVTPLPNLKSGKIAVSVEHEIIQIVIDDTPTRNALTLDMADDLTSAIRWGADAGRVIVLRGQGTHFCSGANRRSGSGMGDGNADPAEILRSHFHPVIRSIADSKVPIITAVSGAAAGFGASLALSGDIVLASEHAFFLQAFRHMALVPDGGSAYLLERAVGRIRANALMLLGERLTASDAYLWGLVTGVLPANTFLEAVDETARSLAKGPTLALGMTRRMTWISAESNLEAVFDAEMIDQCAAAKSEDHRLATEAALNQKEPSFVGR